jgi:putative membrane protein
MVPLHGGSSGPLLTAVIMIIIAGYPVAVLADRRRHWPWHRTAGWIAGWTAAAVAVVGPVARAGQHSFTGHAISHLLLGMLAPLLLAVSAPVTLALRTLPVAGARRLTAILRGRPARILTEPAVVGLLNTGGLWLIYRTDVYEMTQHQPLVHAAVHAHLLLAGVLFTIVIIGTEPLSALRSHLHRAVVLLLAIAGHAVLTKTLYAAPPTGVGRSEAEHGAMIMYYGGDLIHLALIILLCARWYRSARPSERVRLSW